jgi:hypothetical protein
VHPDDEIVVEVNKKLFSYRSDGNNRAARDARGTLAKATLGR